jgi:hypothetical protein
VSVWHKFVMISIGKSGNKAFVVVYEITGHDFFIRRAAVVCVCVAGASSRGHATNREPVKPLWPSYTEITFFIRYCNLCKYDNSAHYMFIMQGRPAR